MKRSSWLNNISKKNLLQHEKYESELNHWQNLNHLKNKSFFVWELALSEISLFPNILLGIVTLVVTCYTSEKVLRRFVICSL
jgi:hypothetical protein